MDMTCRCNSLYTCVACKVNRGDYRDWQCRTCYRAAVRDGLCLGHWRWEYERVAVQVARR